MPGVAAFTSFTFSYLGRALVLLRTLRQAHPDWVVWAVLVDRPPPGGDLPGCDLSQALAAFDHVVYSHELGIERHASWLFKHDIVEACTAVKGHMLAHLLRQGAGKVVYLDPDIAVFHALDDIVHKLDSCSVILTPHQIEPNDHPGVSRDNELTSMKYGIYNLGFVAVRNGPVGRAFADWWSRQLYRACYDDVANGIFTDQKYCDLVPGLFDDVLVERDPGCNVASWNLSRRTLSFDRRGRITVNGSLLKFYHFTKINGDGDIMTEKYAGENTEVIEIWNWYRRSIAGLRFESLPKAYWHYGQFSNGVTIDKKTREFFRSRPDLMAFFDDPYESQGDGSFFNWLCREQPDLLLSPLASAAAVAAAS